MSNNDNHKEEKAVEDKDKKIELLRGLLSQAKTKIENLKILVQSKVHSPIIFLGQGAGAGSDPLLAKYFNLYI